MEELQLTEPTQLCGLCKGSLHRACFEELQNFNTEQQKDVLCPYCYKSWITVKRKIEDKSEPNKKQKNKIELLATKPQKTRVVHLRRSQGKIVQDCDVYIGRKCNMGGWNLPASKWKNPFTIKEHGSAKIVVNKYKEYILTRKDLLSLLPELKGKTLGCWYVHNCLF